jgi:hypothetical protein
MDKLFTKAKILIPGLGWRLLQAFTFSCCFALLPTLSRWLESPTANDAVYAPLYYIFMAAFITPVFWVYSLFYEGRRKKWLDKMIGRV